MKKSLLIVLCLLTSCYPAKKTDDPKVLKEILTKYFDGIKKRDLNMMNSVTTTDFVLFEDGKVWNNDSLVNALNKYKSFDCTVTFDYIKTNVDESSGEIVYLNHGDLTFDTTKIKVDWIENATFKKVEGTWKMGFLHSSVKK